MSISTKLNLANLSPDRVSLLRSLLKLSLDERNALLAEHSVILSQDFTPESDEMEWVEGEIMKVADQIYQIVKKMPEDQANEVLAFAEFLQHKSFDKVQQEVPLKPLPIFKGYLPSGWKDAIYEQEV